MCSLSSYLITEFSLAGDIDHIIQQHKADFKWLNVGMKTFLFLTLN